MRNFNNLIIIACLSMVFAQTADAQSYKAEPYFTADESPDRLRWVNVAPPAENSAAVIYERKQ